MRGRFHYDGDMSYEHPLYYCEHPLYCDGCRAYRECTKQGTCLLEALTEEELRPIMRPIMQYAKGYQTALHEVLAIWESIGDEAALAYIKDNIREPAQMDQQRRRG